MKTLRPSATRLLVLATLAALPLACGVPPQPGEPALLTHRDGERGRGWFVTQWGPEELDYEWHDGEMVYDWDVLLDPDSRLPAGAGGRLQQSLLSTVDLKWAMNASTQVVVIPYVFDNTGGLSQAVYDGTKAKIRRAMDHWEQYVRRPNGSALLSFVPQSGETRFVKFKVANYGKVCRVGLRKTGVTAVESDPACRWQTYVHELGHVLTFSHEQTRKDRAGFVNYYPLNGSNDGQYAPNGGSYLGTTYDSHSIMHYPSCMFALASCGPATTNTWVLERNTCTAPTCRYIKPWSDRAIGDVLSPTDVCGIKTLYGIACTGGCTPTTCAAEGKNCGTLADGCGGSLSCGTCASPKTCGGGGTANLCGCTPTTCAAQGRNCGSIPNGCGGTLSCGSCTSPQSCGGGGTAGVCGCTPTTCAAQGKNCGSIPNGCGGMASCGACPPGPDGGVQLCGGGGANVCGPQPCVPTTCSAEAKNCGTLSNGCGGTLSCGTCASPQTCAGGGTANVCGCTPASCAAQGKDCGSVPDGCGGTLGCGTCAAPSTCGGDGTANVCGQGADAGLPLFPVGPATPGMLQSHATGAALCATQQDGGIELAECEDVLSAQRWAVTPTGALRNAGSGKCAQPSDESEGALVGPRDCRVDEDAQEWRLGDVELVNGQTGRCIAVPSSDYFPGQKLVYKLCSGAPNQRFAFLPDTHELKAQGWCLTAGATSGGNVKLQACDGSLGQRWIETSGGFATGANQSLCLRVQGGANAATGASIEVAACNGLVGQMWGLRGQVAHFNDEFCAAASGSGAALKLGLCAASSPAQTLVWWPRGACVPLGCADLGAACGSFDDGCGAALECGACSTDPVDGGLTEGPCVPWTCVDLDAACGEWPDGCGATVDCGACGEEPPPPPAPEGCGCTTAGSTAALWPVGLALLAAARRRRGTPAQR